MTITLPSLTIVLGGAASGKSTFAEQLVTAIDRSPVYIATAQAYDAEMAEKIYRHQASRGPGWRTIEAPLDLPAALATARKTDAVLIDCATLWLTNHLLAGHDLVQQEQALLAALTACAAPVVIVSNEVGAGIVPETPLGRQFRNAQGRLNQKLAAQADLAVTVIAGLPMVLKGQLPDGQT